jgi:hypothetical protein
MKLMSILFFPNALPQLGAATDTSENLVEGPSTLCSFSGRKLGEVGLKYSNNLLGCLAGTLLGILHNLSLTLFLLFFVAHGTCSIIIHSSE